jgi:hypothetical protein
MPVRRIEVPQDILDDTKKVSLKSPEETLAYWLKRGHDTDENVNSAYEAYDVLLSSEEIQNARVIKMPEHHKKAA